MEKVYISVRRYRERKRPRLVLEIGNQGIVLATFRNTYAANIWTWLIGNGKAIVLSDDRIDSMDDLLRKVKKDEK